MDLVPSLSLERPLCGLLVLVLLLVRRQLIDGWPVQRTQHRVLTPDSHRVLLDAPNLVAGVWAVVLVLDV
jgi:hypothetical protein